ncbi:MAG: hypothetical protein OEV06_01655 [Anaerolineae bacterium]|nr:hypothetical protein [Anaerolineae bacterium]
MDNKLIGRWAHIMGAIIAIIVGLEECLQSVQFLTWVVILLGVVAGLFSVTDESFTRKVILYLGLVATQDALLNLVGIGEILTAVISAYVIFLGPVVLTASLKAGYKMYRG